MAAKRNAQIRPRRTSAKKKAAAVGNPVYLTLTLVPLVVGVLLIGAWALDIAIWDNPQSQVFVGIFFMLVSFAASNALQKRWNLAIGWALLMAADLVLLAWLQLWAQAVALVVGAIGLVILIREFYQQYRHGLTDRTEK